MGKQFPGLGPGWHRGEVSAVGVGEGTDDSGLLRTVLKRTILVAGAKQARCRNSQDSLQASRQFGEGRFGDLGQHNPREMPQCRATSIKVVVHLISVNRMLRSILTVFRSI
jgi:hypothetical protein